MSKFQLIIALAAVVNAIIAVLNFCKEYINKKKKTKAVIKAPKIWIPVLIAAICISIAFILGRISNSAVDTARYSFESGTDGWAAETYHDSQGVIAIEQSSDRAKFGKHSLKLTVDIEGGHENRQGGEVFVDIPMQNLKDKPIIAWVYVPEEAIGERDKPNGIQVFVKDSEWRSEYGTWWQIKSGKVNSWQQVTLTPSTTEPYNGYIAPEFDPTHIIAIGVRIAIGEDLNDISSKATFKGFIYIDSVDWP